MKMIPFSQYPGCAIAPDGSKISTPQGEYALTAGKLFGFVNPNSGVKTYILPEVLLARATKGQAAPAATPVVATKAATKKRQPSKAKTEAQKVKAFAKAQREADKAKKAAQKQARKDQLARRKATSAVNAVKKNKKKYQLIPDLAVKHLLEKFEAVSQGKTNAVVSYRHEFDNGNCVVYTVLANIEAKMVLLRVAGTGNWRDALFFFSPVTQQYLAYEEALHKPGYGDASVIWPELPTQEMFP